MGIFAIGNAVKSTILGIVNTANCATCIQRGIEMDNQARNGMPYCKYIEWRRNAKPYSACYSVCVAAGAKGIELFSSVIAGRMIYNKKIVRLAPVPRISRQ